MESYNRFYDKYLAKGRKESFGPNSDDDLFGPNSDNKELAENNPASTMFNKRMGLCVYKKNTQMISMRNAVDEKSLIEKVEHDLKNCCDN